MSQHEKIFQTLNSKFSITKENFQKYVDFLKQKEYEIEKFIGEGGQGVVIQGKHKQNQQVAIKIIQANDSQKLKDAIKEAEIQKQLSSPFIVKIIDSFAIGLNSLQVGQGVFVIITKYCSKGDLYNYKYKIENGKKVPNNLSEKDIASKFYDILRGIFDLHSYGFIHSDLKPQNVFISEDGRAQIADFGLAKKAQVNTSNHQTDSKGGSFYYMDQSQFLFQKINKRTDYYSAGAILYFLCGIDFEEEIEMSMKIKNGNFPNLAQNNFSFFHQISKEMMNINSQQRLRPQDAIDKIIKKYQLQDIILPPQVLNQQNGTYTGEMVEGKKHGYGTFKFITEDMIKKEYKGEWRNDKMNGNGILEVGDTIYSGQFLDDTINGHGKTIKVKKEEFVGLHFESHYVQGVLKWLNDPHKSKYQGRFKDGKMEGSGVLIYKNNDEYHGQFENDQFNGNGTLKTKNFIFYGQFKNNQINGIGAIIFKDRQKYFGEFFNGQKQGQGQFVDTKTKLIQVGSFVNDKFTDNGTQFNGKMKGLDNISLIETHNNQCKGIFVTQKSVYIGPLSNKMKDGQGKEIFKSGNTYIGEYLNDKYHGKGKFTWRDGSSYTGDYENGLIQGKGELIFSNGIIFRGNFINGQLCDSDGEINWKNGNSYKGEVYKNVLKGKGKYHFQDRRMYEGKFDNNQFHGNYEKYTWPNGSVYQGAFRNGQKHGDGKIIFQDGSSFEGQFQNNSMKYGKFLFSKENFMVSYIGEFVKNLREGQGETKFLNGDIHNGIYKKGKEEGSGKFFFGKGGSLEGSWQNGLKNGVFLHISGQYKWREYYVQGVSNEAIVVPFEGQATQGKGNNN